MRLVRHVGGLQLLRLVSVVGPVHLVRICLHLLGLAPATFWVFSSLPWNAPCCLPTSIRLVAYSKVIFTVLCLLYGFKKNYFLFFLHHEDHWRKEQDPDPVPDPIVRGTDPRFPIHTQMSQIRNTFPRFRRTFFASALFSRLACIQIINANFFHLLISINLLNFHICPRQFAGVRAVPCETCEPPMLGSAKMTSYPVKLSHDGDRGVRSHAGCEAHLQFRNRPGTPFTKGEKWEDGSVSQG